MVFDYGYARLGLTAPNATGWVTQDTVTVGEGTPAVRLTGVKGELRLAVGDREYALARGEHTVEVRDGSVLVDGEPLKAEDASGSPLSVTVVVNGDVGRTEVVGSLTVTGAVTGGASVTGTMTCGRVVAG